MTIKPIKVCRICHNTQLVSICNLGTMALTGIFPKTKNEKVPQGPLELVVCQGDPKKVCGLLQLKNSFDPKLLFGNSYGYRSGLNESMKSHLKRLAKAVGSFVQLKEKDTVIDIGSNDGTLLEAFCGKDLNLIGIDPLVGKFKKHYHPSIKVIEDFFPKKTFKSKLGKAKLIMAVAVLYDFNDPVSFLKKVQDSLAKEGVLVLEQGYRPAMLKKNSYDAICHEHATYYGLSSIKWLADKVCLKIVSCSFNTINGGSLRVMLAHKDSSFREVKAEVETIIKVEKQDEKRLKDFSKNILKHRQELLQRINQLISKGKTIAGYGASTKGNVLLQFCGLTSKEISFMAEINEDKWGRFCPGTKIPIISQKEASFRKPDVYLVLPWHFKKNILAREKRFLKSGGSFLFPFPKVHST